ncbi:hypothetical protein PpBr36_04071 [Pyricularia pennisetigena]|uniref:hypothetical protein n=1 Tax=Pyricularia pennisetigena TaxID=1578925 RepID=UPI001154C6E7|nr:hypothetical protein PpBr36_04071 [Pyricularia pennisetigena]TLS26556.1 hypothetical protein PpBr36_04071 [Pyricularia pennisetigena]
MTRCDLLRRADIPTSALRLPLAGRKILGQLPEEPDERRGAGGSAVEIVVQEIVFQHVESAHHISGNPNFRPVIVIRVYLEHDGRAKAIMSSEDEYSPPAP